MSERFDCNGFIGEWPFRRFYHGGMEGLQKVWEQAGIDPVNIKIIEKKSV